MTDPFTPGGAGLPDQPPNPPAAAQPEPDAATPDEGGAGFGMPLGMTDMPTSAASGDTGGSPAGEPPAAPGSTLGGWGQAPPAGWVPGSAPGGALPGGPALTPASGRRPGVSKRLIGIVVVVVLIAAAFFVFRDRLSAAPGDLRVGDCFDVPTAASEADVISTVQQHPCTETHTGEVFFVATYTGPDATYPAITDFDNFANTTCTPAFQAYVGIDLDSSPDLSAGYFYPPEDGWNSGDRTILCYIERTDSGPMTKSAKDSESAPPSSAPAGSTAP